MGRKELPPDEKRVKYTFSLDADVLNNAKLLAHLEKRSVSSVVDDAIRAYTKSILPASRKKSE